MSYKLLTPIMAGALTIVASAAVAQNAPHAATGTIPEGQAKGLMKKPMPAERRLPRLPRETFDFRPSPGPVNPPQIAPGNVGGKPASSVNVATEPVEASENSQDSIGTQNYGTGNVNTVYHYSDHRIEPSIVPKYPYRTSGYFLNTFNGTDFFFCTATLISKSILVTAGHCIYDTGANKYATAATFYPACVNCNGGGALVEPYGRATARYFLATKGWRDATPSTALDQGFDVGLVVLNKRAGTTTEIGTYTGSLPFCHTDCLQPFWQLSQLGYPSNYDGGNRMNYGEHIEKSNTRDYQHGSGMQGGSSGGPHISNIGNLLDSATNKGEFTARNRVFAVTSWGYTDESVKIQGSSSLSGPSNSNNFKSMYNNMCNKAIAMHGAGSCTLLQ